MQKRQHLMVDYAEQDPRSVPAMLRGRGDGRERLWLKFIEKLTQTESKDLESVMEAFHLKVKRGDIELDFRLFPMRVSTVTVLTILFWVI